MMEPVAERLSGLLRGMTLHAPKLPFASSVTGTWITTAQATDPVVLVAPPDEHGALFRRRGDDGGRGGIRVLLETGPGHGLRMLAAQLTVWGDEPPVVVASMRHAYERQPDAAHVLGAAGRLWAAGVPVDWHAMHAHERLRRVPLPTYPFERRRHWIERPTAGSAASVLAARGGSGGHRCTSRRGGARRSPLPFRGSAEPASWLVLADGAGVGARLAERLRTRGHTVGVAEPGERFGRAGEGAWTVRPGSAADLAALREALDASGAHPGHVVQLWGIGYGR